MENFGRASAAIPQAKWNQVAASSGWAAPNLGNLYAPYSANVIWQDTTSNATYCSASAALGSTA